MQRSTDPLVQLNCKVRRSLRDQIDRVCKQAGIPPFEFRRAALQRHAEHVQAEIEARGAEQPPAAA